MSPVSLFCLLFIAILECHWVPVDCYGNGKVTKVCGSMEPLHVGKGQVTTSPYRLETNTTMFSPRDRIKVILSGTSDFEGFLLQARDAVHQGSESTIGTFTLTSPDTTQLLTCSKHSSVSMATFSRVTVVAAYDIFWVKIPGPIINQYDVTSFQTQSSTTPAPVPSTTPSILPGPFTSEECGQSKSCILDPPGCDPKDPHCFFLSMTTAEGVFELSGPADGYLSFALSWDTWMGNDDVYLCVKDGSKVSVSAAFVNGRTHPKDQSQVIYSICYVIEVLRYDLDQEYFLFLANGQAQHGKIRKHSLQPLISIKKKLITGPPEVLKGSRGPILMKMHGALMLVAWMLTGSIGTFIASFYKPDWPNQTLLSQKVWFQFHRGLMTITVALTIAAFCLPFFYRKGWSKHAGVHPYLGLCVLTLSLIQPIMANTFIYMLCSLTAVAAMFLGMRQSSLFLPQPWTTYVLIVYVIWLASFRILFLIHKHFHFNRCMKTSIWFIYLFFNSKFRFLL
uniref:Cytochrome b561 domain-containing protein n=1 Tax=Mola mola TaxID=94237 RepID=A0A3Q3XRL5_MOLML